MADAKPPRTHVRPIPARAYGSEWTISSVRAALDALENGQFSQAARLADAIGRRGRIAGARKTRKNALGARAGLPFDVIKSDEGDQRRAEMVATRVERRWWTSIPDGELAAFQETTVDLGACVGYLSWRAVETTSRVEWVPHLHWLPPHNLDYNDHTKLWTYQTMDGIETVTPGDGRWVLHLPYGPRSWMDSAVRAIGEEIVDSSYTSADWRRWNEKHGLPILAVKEPFFAEDDTSGGGVSEKDAFYQRFATIGQDGALGLPQGQDGEGGWEADWLELKQPTAWQSFQAQFQRIVEAAREFYLGHSDEGSKGGDGESNREHVRLERLTADAEGFSTTFREQIWAPYGRYNFRDWSDELAPWGRWDTQPPADRKARAAMLSNVAKALPTLASAGADTRELLAEFGVPLVPEGQEPRTDIQPVENDPGNITNDEEDTDAV